VRRSLRYTGTKINKIAVDTNETAREHELAEADANADPVKLQDLVGGRDAYTTLNGVCVTETSARDGCLQY
jgi:hypothetical protein